MSLNPLVGEARPSKQKQATSKKRGGKAPDKSAGWKVPRIKKGSLFEKMKLKEGDRIQSIEGRRARSKKQIYQDLLSLSKKKREISFSIIRDNTTFLVSYKIEPFKTKTKITISKIKRIDNKITDKTKLQAKARGARKRKLASIQNKTNSQSLKMASAKNKKTKKQTKKSAQRNKKKPAPEKNKRSLVPKKYKAHLQSAYVASLNSFIYKKPNFDSPQLQALPIGKKILISKKLFRPHHNFGSFYKALLFKEKKIVGYISEAEVIPAYLKQNGKYKANPDYKIAKYQMAKDKVLDTSLIDKVRQKNQPKKQASAKPTNNKKRYAGLSLGFLKGNVAILDQRDIYIGFKLSGYNLLLSYLNMDINLMATPYNLKFFYFDILTAYPALRYHPYHLFIMAGFNSSIDKNIKDPVDYGLSGALSLAFAINKKILFRTEAKTVYGFRTRSLRYGLLGSFQIAF